MSARVMFVAMCVAGCGAGGGAATSPTPSPQDAPDASVEVPEPPPADPEPSGGQDPPPSTDESSESSNAADEIVFRFEDASVPPKYHRSYTIVVTPTKITKTVDSYGDILADEEMPMSPAGYEELVKAIRRYGLSSQSGSSDSDGCTGGTSRSLKWVEAGKVKVDGSLYKCGGSHDGTLKGNVDAIQSMLLDLAPKAAAP